MLSLSAGNPNYLQLAKESGKIYSQQILWHKTLRVNKKTGNCYAHGLMNEGCDRKQRVSNCVMVNSNTEAMGSLRLLHTEITTKISEWEGFRDGRFGVHRTAQSSRVCSV